MAEAGALLLPDGDSWRVAAGEGLRRLEHRYVLAADSWLVHHRQAHKGAIIDRTDVARERCRARRSRAHSTSWRRRCPASRHPALCQRATTQPSASATSTALAALGDTRPDAAARGRDRHADSLARALRRVPAARPIRPGDRYST